MNTPKRLIETSDNPWLAELVQAGRNEMPRDEVVAYALGEIAAASTLSKPAALALQRGLEEGAASATQGGIGLSSAGAGAHNAGAAAVGQLAGAKGVVTTTSAVKNVLLGASASTKAGVGAALGGTLSKWGALGALGMAASFGAPHLVDSFENKPAAQETHGAVTEPTPTTPPRPVVESASASAAPSSAAGPELVPSPEGDSPVPTRRAVRAPPPARTSANAVGQPSASDHLERELRLLERAQSALDSGHAATALSLLERYRHSSGAKQLLPEAKAMQREALMELGQAQQARAVPDEIVETGPNRPGAERAWGATDSRSGEAGRASSRSFTESTPAQEKTIP